MTVLKRVRKQWVEVDLHGLGKILQRRGIEFILYELIQNAWDEDVTKVEVRFTWQDGLARILCVDDSPTGFRDMADSYTLYRESYKKEHSNKRGVFNAGEKFVLALCEEATITSTTGTVRFKKDGTRTQNNQRKLMQGTRFEATMRMLQRDYLHICEAVKLLIPPVHTVFNGETLTTSRLRLHSFRTSLPTVVAGADGVLMPAQRATEVVVYEPQAGETARLYEMGIPVVETGDKWHIDIQQKVPLNLERDNVTPAFLRRVRVSVLNQMAEQLNKEDATETWVKEAVADPYAATDAIKKVMDLRFGENRVAFDPSDIGSNREAASKNFTVVHGGTLSSGEWESVRRAEAMPAAGQLFSTKLEGKTPEKTYQPHEYTADMKWYETFVNWASTLMIGSMVELEFIRDPQIVLGCYDPTFKIMTCNLARIPIAGRPSKEFLDLMIHELAHDTVRTNDHLIHGFYHACTELGAKLTRLAIEFPERFQ